jgi:hypothetical protein
MPLRPAALKWGRVPTLALVLVCALFLPAAAQPKKKGGAPAAPPPSGEKADKAEAPTSTDAKPADKTDKKKSPKEKNFDFNAMDLNGRMRTPQLLYFLERANEELERASLEKRSFIPHMVRSVEEEQL